jgi:hypothetical protein
MSSWDRTPGPRVSQPPIVQDDLPGDEDASGFRRFVRRSAAAVVMITVVFGLLAVYLVISLF